jgi:hypothetical protein
MKEYIALAAGTIFLVVIVGFIIPEGKLKNIINFALRLICIYVLIQPIGKVFNFNYSDNQTSVDYQYICAVYSQSQSAQLQNMIYENLGLECECEIEIIYEDDTLKENGVTVLGDFVDEQTKTQLCEYLQSLGYININVNVNEKAD